MKSLKKLLRESGQVSRTLLEGYMLYSELKLTSLKTYNVIIALENKGLIKKIQLPDGEYYTLKF